MSEWRGWRVAIDTAAGINVGLAHDGQPVARRALKDTRIHAELTQVLVNQLVTDAGISLHQIGGVVVGLGPGPFTGLRVGIVTGLTLGMLVGAPVRGVCTLDAVAATWLASHHVVGEFVVVTDARRSELYWARYLPDGTRVGSPQVSAPEAVDQLPVIGPGVGVYPQLLASRGLPGAGLGLDAGLLAAHADRLEELGHEPIYLRKPDTSEPGTRKSTLTSRRVHLADTRPR